MKTYFEFIQQLNEVAKGGTVPWAGKTRGPYDKSAGGRRMLADLEADAKQYADRMREMQPIYTAIDAYRAGKHLDAATLKMIEPYIKQLGIQKGVAKNKLAPTAQAVKAETRPPFNWYTGGAGWWHPTKKWFRFAHDGGNYHVTQIVKNPQVFGITNQELNDAMFSYGKNRYTGSKYSKEEITMHVRRSILDGTQDLCMPVQRLAYKLGWLKVYGGSGQYLEGYEKYMRLAVQEIMKVVGVRSTIELGKVKENSHEYWPENVKYLSTEQQKEKYITR
jgi:hypothetical protein